MFEVLSLVIFIWLMMKVIGLMFRVTWGMAKVIACLLIGLALPALFVCLIFVGGIASLDFVWETADLLNAFMVIPNLIALFALQRYLPKK